MNIKKLLLAASAAAVLTAAGALAAPPDRGGPPPHRDMDHHGNRHDGNRDRYWRPEYRHGYVDRDRAFREMRRHHYNRFIGDPYFYLGRYVVRTYDRFGHVVFVEINPYTGIFIGVIRF